MKTVRETRAGDLLVEFGPDAANKDSFGDEVPKAHGQKATISSLDPMATLEIRNIDYVTDVSEVKEALKREFATAGNVRVRVTPESNRG